MVQEPAKFFLMLSLAFSTLLVNSSCSQPPPQWPPVEEGEYVSIVGPLLAPQLGGSYEYSKLARQIILSLDQKQKIRKTGVAEPQMLRIKVKDWILERNKYLAVWERIQTDARSESGAIDNSKLALIIKEAKIHEEPHTLVIHVKKLDQDDPDSVRLEGYRYISRSEDEYLANAFEINLRFKNRDAQADLENAIMSLIAGKVYSSPSLDYLGFVTIPEGCFEKDGKEVCTDEFRLNKTPVTQKQWLSVMKSNPTINNQGDLFPVTNISREDIRLFIDALNEKSDRVYRLPTEAEWEMACRNAKKNDQFGTADGTISHRYANYLGKDDLDTWASSSPVGMFPPNKLGLYDMSGNIWEWTEDRKDRRNIISRFIFNYLLFMIPEKPKQYVIKGGSFDSFAEELRCSYKEFMFSYAQTADLGFRLVLED